MFHSAAPLSFPQGALAAPLPTALFDWRTPNDRRQSAPAATRAASVVLSAIGGQSQPTAVWQVVAEGGARGSVAEGSGRT